MEVFKLNGLFHWLCLFIVNYLKESVIKLVL